MAEPGLRRVAAIDCGTNSLRLLIADIDPAKGELSELYRRMEIVRLGQGVDATGRLAPDALARTFATLGEFDLTIGEFGASAIRMVATSATRDASNASEFAAGVRQVLGVYPEVVTGTEEARLSFSGATAEFASDSGHPEPPFLVTDIGGGSTEFVLGSLAGLGAGLDARSVNIGCVRLTERHLHGNPPTEPQIPAAPTEFEAALATVGAAMLVTSARTLVGLAGSVTTLTAIALDLAVYDPLRVHHARIRADRVHEVTVGLLSHSHAERSRIGAIHPGRVDVIGAGALILDRIMTTFGFDEVIASEHDILDGIAWSMVTERDPESPPAGLAT
jgi:exopolyphosphatase/guanosine-5'-triphosphate,3'-diphosphate pyrophosphatase